MYIILAQKVSVPYHSPKCGVRELGIPKIMPISDLIVSKKNNFGLEPKGVTLKTAADPTKVLLFRGKLSEITTQNL